MTSDTNQPAPRILREAIGRVPGDGVELAFGYWPGRGRPLVAIHGLTATYMTFIGIAELLAGRWPLFSLDLRGRGDSDKPPGPYGMAQHARDVAAAMRTMGLGPSVIVGHSMGAFVATALAAQEPSLVAGLVLIDGGYVPDFEAAPGPKPALDPLLAERVTLLSQTYPSREAYRAMWKRKPHFPLGDWGPWVEAFIDSELGGEPPVLRPKALEQAVREDIVEGFRHADVASRLRAVRVPALMIRAGAGFAPGLPPLYPDLLFDQMKALLPHLEDHLISGSTHYTILLGVQGATQTTGILDEFARRLSGDQD
jgi:pimeloyl-ACP methyl ester carboxylesterase